MNGKLDARAVSLSIAVVAAGLMLLLGVFGRFGIYEGAADMMMQWHLFFSLSVAGIIAGMIEAFVVSLVLVYPTSRLYNGIAATEA